MVNYYHRLKLLRWISEKMDGVRGYWDGTKFFSRHGNPIQTPHWFVERFPVIPLDGELWMGRGTFEKLVKLLNSKDITSSAWREVRYHAFDLPASSCAVEQRIQQLKEFK